VGLQSQQEYGEMIREILRLLDGRTGAVRKEIAAEMEAAVRELRFEDAARHRDVLRGLDSISREQRAEGTDGGDRDILGIARDGSLGAAVVLKIRRGVLLGRESHRFDGIAEESDSDLLGSFTTQAYLLGGTEADRDLPQEVLLPMDFADREVLEGVLTERAGRRVRLLVPERGDKTRLIELAVSNARSILEERVLSQEGAPERADSILYDLQERLGLKVVPRLIACVDISHTQGSELVASVIVFENGEPKKSLYRKMRIRGAWTNDDFRSMGEVVERYLSRRIAEGEPLPELLLLDGGKGQLSAVEPVLSRIGAPEIALAALAKRQEEIFRPGLAEPLRLSRRDPALRLLQRIRNEAHRVALGYNRKLRGRRTLTSELGRIPGVGPARQRSLLTHFGSVKGVREASEDELEALPGFSKVLAQRVLMHLKN
jgi:excinuclease ABC subunit C